MDLKTASYHGVDVSSTSSWLRFEASGFEAQTVPIPSCEGDSLVLDTISMVPTSSVVVTIANPTSYALCGEFGITTAESLVASIPLNLPPMATLVSAAVPMQPGEEAWVQAVAGARGALLAPEPQMVRVAASSTTYVNIDTNGLSSVQLAGAIAQDTEGYELCFVSFAPTPYQGGAQCDNMGRLLVAGLGPHTKYGLRSCGDTIGFDVGEDGRYRLLETSDTVCLRVVEQGIAHRFHLVVGTDSTAAGHAQFVLRSTIVQAGQVLALLADRRLYRFSSSDITSSTSQVLDVATGEQMAALHLVCEEWGRLFPHTPLSVRAILDGRDMDPLLPSGCDGTMYWCGQPGMYEVRLPHGFCSSGSPALLTCRVDCIGTASVVASLGGDAIDLVIEGELADASCVLIHGLNDVTAKVERHGIGGIRLPGLLRYWIGERPVVDVQCGQRYRYAKRAVWVASNRIVAEF